jgi:hypothetical protein
MGKAHAEFITNIMQGISLSIGYLSRVENQTIKKKLYTWIEINIKMLDEFVARKLNIQKVFIFIYFLISFCDKKNKFRKKIENWNVHWSFGVGVAYVTKIHEIHEFPVPLLPARELPKMGHMGMHRYLLYLQKISHHHRYTTQRKKREKKHTTEPVPSGN